MAEVFPHVSTDQVRAFVEVSRHGQIRAAAAVLAVSEQGLRNRLLALEAQIGVELYRKIRGPRRLTVLTDAGRRLPSPTRWRCSSGRGRCMRRLRSTSDSRRFGSSPVST